jgi:hypothetical protein
MRLDRFLTVLAAALLTTAPVLHAQQSEPLMPRSGSWGAEAVYGGANSANLLRFSSPTAAWLAGLSFNVVRQTDDASGFPGAVNQSYLLGSVDARVGRRWWRGGAGEHVRPLSGLGLLGGLSSGSGLQSWSAGGYGELGATYFFSPHVSLGATGEVAAGYSHERFSIAAPADRTTTRWFVRGNLVRVAAGVYF